ncbi:helix-turn-helix domain-containing protein [Paludibacter sp. 221]|uniref:helix-turn-helix domain-containing protein n=1 Tax=Paludibacter sp. 221 TaxID=2302939 RepID=UPI00351BDEF7
MELSEKVEITPQNRSKLINEKIKPSLATYEKIAEALGVHVSELFEQPDKDYINCPNCGTKLKLETK